MTRFSVRNILISAPDQRRVARDSVAVVVAVTDVAGDCGCSCTCSSTDGDCGCTCTCTCTQTSGATFGDDLDLLEVGALKEALHNALAALDQSR